MFWKRKGATTPHATIPATPPGPEPLNEPDRRRRPDLAGVKVMLGNGQEWTLAPYPRRLDGIWDQLYDSNVARGQYAIPAVMTGAMHLLLENYVLTFDEAWLLIRWARPQDLVAPVESALTYPGHPKRKRTRSEWIYSSLYANGLDPEAIPREHLDDVLRLLIASGRACPIEDFVTSAKVADTREFLKGFMTTPPPTPPTEAGDAAGNDDGQV